MALRPDETAHLARLSGHRAAAIGGIDATNAATLYAAGLEGVAVVSAICSAGDPGAAAQGPVRLMREYRAAWRRVRPAGRGRRLRIRQCRGRLAVDGWRR
jgi:pyridoxal biosynthesis lyase PdxS